MGDGGVHAVLDAEHGPRDPPEDRRQLLPRPQPLALCMCVCMYVCGGALIGCARLLLNRGRLEEPLV
jgi:hypothetical protein